MPFPEMEGVDPAGVVTAADARHQSRSGEEEWVVVSDSIAAPQQQERRGDAVDVVCVRRRDGMYACSEWSVRFGSSPGFVRKNVSWAYVSVASSLSRWRTSYDASRRRRRALRERRTDFSDDEANEEIEEVVEEMEEVTVKVFVNDELVNVRIQVEPDGWCTFPSPKCRPSEAELAGFDLREGPNETRIEYEHEGCVEVAYFHCYFWDVGVPVVVCDVDGTVSRSDAAGFVEKVASESSTHRGVSSFFSGLNAHLIYLTSRPVSLADHTRAYLFSTGVSMPRGPVITSRESVFGALYSELVTKTPDIFKTKALLDINHTFAGTPLKAGFGNRITDCTAYARASVPTDAIFMIDTDSHLILPFAPPPSPTYQGYHDPLLAAKIEAGLKAAPRPRPLGRRPPSTQTNSSSSKLS